jgi:hypothetical protein
MGLPRLRIQRGKGQAVSAFDSTFLMLRHPNGGVEDLRAMKEAGYAGVFCNIGDHPPEAWEYIVRPRARALGMYCGPWLHTRQGDGRFAPGKLEALIACADRWGSPLIVNSEKEIDGSGDACTGMIAEEVGDRDAAISMEAWLFNPPSVDWSPVSHLPMLLQIFPQESPPARDPEACKLHAHDCGVECVYFTYGSYGGVRPSLYSLISPFSIYTADDLGGDYAAWRPRGEGFQACVETRPDGGGDVMEKIGNQDGINAAVDRLIALDPGGSKPNRKPDDLGTWGAYDKLRRTLALLKDDHDARASAS